MATARAAARTRLRRQRLLAGPVGKVLFTLSWPLSLGLFSVIAFNVVDTLYIGQLGPDPLAAIGYCFPVIFCMSAVAIGMGNGATSVVSRSLGRGDTARACVRTTDTIIYVTILSLLMIGGMFLIDDMVFRWLGTPPDLMPYIHQYMNVWFVGLPLLMLPIVLNGLIRATGDAIFPSSMMMLAAGINAVISPFLVFGLWGAPDLGMAGAAWSTLIARGILVAMCLGYLWRENLVSLLDHDFSVFMGSVSEITRFGAPAFLAQVVAPLSGAVAVRLLSASGPDAVAAYTVATRIESLMLVPLFSLGAGIGPFTGQNVGAGNTARLKTAQTRALTFSLICGVVGAVFMISFGGTIAGFFSTDPEIIDLADRFLTLIALGLWGAGFLYVAVGVANPLGYPNLGMALSILRHLVLFTGGSILLVVGLGFDPTRIVLVIGPVAYGVAGITAALVTRWLLVRTASATGHSEALPTRV
ncbi:MAG: MATE family efflux transporter [Pseudomonadota bacterium]